MNNDIAAAFARLEEWANAGELRSYDIHRYITIGFQVGVIGVDRNESRRADTFPAAVDAALKAWEEKT